MKLLIKPKSFIIAMCIAGVSLACNSKEEKTDEISILSAENNQLALTIAQFESSNMKLGKLIDHRFSSSIQANGRIEVPPENRVSVSTHYGGFIDKINLLPGDKVLKGQVLFTMTNPEFIQMQQDYLEAKTKLNYLKEDYERQQTLAKENINSKKSYLKAETDYKVTSVRFESLKKKLLLININPNKINESNLHSFIQIPSPINGYIAYVNVNKGIYLNPSEIAIELIDTSHIHLDLNVFEKNVQRIKEGQNITFHLPDSNTTYAAVVHLVGKIVDDATRTINIHGHLKDESLSSLFVLGMYVAARIEINSIVSKALPEDAVVNVGEQYYVLVKKEVLGDEILFSKEEVFIGKPQNGFVEILNANSFKENDEIVSRGAFDIIN